MTDTRIQEAISPALIRMAADIFAEGEAESAETIEKLKADLERVTNERDEGRCACWVSPDAEEPVRSCDYHQKLEDDLKRVTEELDRSRSRAESWCSAESDRNKERNKAEREVAVLKADLTNANAVLDAEIANGVKLAAARCGLQGEVAELREELARRPPLST